ncbi:MAG: LysE family transporter [Anaerolineae bacterium]
MITDYLIPGATIALSAIAIPGPLTAYIINTALRYGWRRSLIVVFSPLITDPPVITILLLTLGSLQSVLPGFTRLVQVIGGIVLLVIAYNGWKSFRAGATFGGGTSSGGGSDAAASPKTNRQLLTTSVLMNLLSPGLYIVWTTINGPLLLQGLNVSLWHGLAFLIGFYGVFFSGLALIGFVFARTGQISPRLTRILTAGTIVLLLYFAIRLIVTAIFPT